MQTWLPVLIMFLKNSMRLIRSPRLTETFDIICTVHPKWGGRVLRIQYQNYTRTMLELFLQMNYLLSSGLLAFTFVLTHMGYSVVNMYFGGMTFLSKQADVTSFEQTQTSIDDFKLGAGIMSELLGED